MATGAYPVQYFYCNDWGQSENDIFKMLQIFTDLSIAAGPIAGETGIDGLKIDFNHGLRLQVPTGNWHVTIGDYDSGIVFYDQDVSETILISVEKYYIHWQVEVFRDGEPVFAHVFDPTGQKIGLVVVSTLIGDMQSFLPYFPMVRDWYHADVYLYIDGKMREICQRLFPDIRQRDGIEEDTYATYYFAAGFGLWGWTPLDGRTFPMMQTGQLILGLPYPAPKVPWVAGPRTIKEAYVCIGVQANTVSKGWHYPGGWEEVTSYLKGLGYRVLCVDRDKRAEEAGYVAEIPTGAEDFTGNRPLLERADMLHHAEFFIGLCSGLSWLAYTADCPVIMIGGFSIYWTEFPTPYRVYNRLVCNGCYNDLRVSWQEHACPRQEGDAKNYLKCSKSITPRMVIQAIDRLIADKRAGRIPAYR